MTNREYRAFLARLCLRAKAITESLPELAADVDQRCRRMTVYLRAGDNRRLWPELVAVCEILDDAENDQALRGGAQH